MASNFSEPSSPSSSTTSSTCEWEMLENNINNQDIGDFIETLIPRSYVYQTNHNVKCHFCVNDLELVAHKIKRQYRKCQEEARCSVKYRVDYCSTKDVGRIEQSGQHSHHLAESYDNENGICDEIKSAILKILEFNPTKFPKAIQVQLTTEKEKFQIQHFSITSLVKIQGFVHRSRHKVKPKRNKVEDVINFIMSNLLFATIHTNTPFFFGLEFDSSNRAKLGEGSKL